MHKRHKWLCRMTTAFLLDRQKRFYELSQNHYKELIFTKFLRRRQICEKQAKKSVFRPLFGKFDQKIVFGCELFPQK